MRQAIRSISFFGLIWLSSLNLFSDPTVDPFPLAIPGEFPVLYEKYGHFTGVGTNQYKYTIDDRPGLIKAMGEGLYPNNAQSLLADPNFVEWEKTHPKDLSLWSFIQTDDPQSDFYVWARTSSVGPGTKLLFIGKALQSAGHWSQALKAYHAVVVHFPRETCPSADNTFAWSVAQEAINQMETIMSHHPEIGWKLNGLVYQVVGGESGDKKINEVVVDPGTWVKSEPKKPVDLGTLRVTQTRGQGLVQLKQYENGHWQLTVGNKPMVIHGITYQPTKVGRDMSDMNGSKWMFEDANKNGKPDAPYDAFVDKNGNNKQDPDEPSVGDFRLMQDMGVNAIRVYYSAQTPAYNPAFFNKTVLRDLTKKYGIRVILGDMLGAYTIGSGASWEEGTDYRDPKQRARMKAIVKGMVLDHKDEPYVLMWLLGNENLMPADYDGGNATRTNASTATADFLSFVNEVAAMIHKLDRNHPVAIGNLETIKLDGFAKYAPEIDIYGANSYRGLSGFGRLWRDVRQQFDRPVLITEYGCDALQARTFETDEGTQAAYHKGNWRDIAFNLGGGTGEGNAIGGVIFEYLDEWWKSSQGNWFVHDKVNDVPMAFPDAWDSEEWLGIVSQGDGSLSPFLRQPRKTYYIYRDELWKK